MSDTPICERLLRAAWNVTHDESEPWEDALAIEKQPYVMELDAILQEMKEPSEGMLAAGVRATMDYPDGLREATCWVLLSDAGLNAKALAGPLRAMIQHIRDGGS